MDNILKDELDWIKSEQLTPRDDWDWITLLIGKERSGKSAIAQQMGYHIDPTLDVSRIVFTSEEFDRAVRKAKNGQCIIFDEGIEGFFTKEAMSYATKSLNKLLAIIGYKHLFIIIILPSWKMVEGLLKDRLKLMIRVYPKRDGMHLKRGFYDFFSVRSIRKIYTDNATKQVIFPYPDYKGTFADINTIPELKKLWKDYNEKKHRFGSVQRNEEVWKRSMKNAEEMKKAFTLRDIATINNTKIGTVRQWVYRNKIFPKKALFKDIFGELRISKKDYDKYFNKFVKSRQKKRRT
jgi:hypothetical protein